MSEVFKNNRAKIRAWALMYYGPEKLARIDAQRAAQNKGEK